MGEQKLRIVFLVDDTSYISSILLDSFYALEQVEVVKIFSRVGEDENVLKSWLRYGLRGKDYHPKYRNKISKRYSVKLIDELNVQVFAQELRGMSWDVVMLLGYSKVLNSAILKYLGRTLNFHNSLLPAYRGVYATHVELLDGNLNSGVSYHWVDEGIDSGEVIFQKNMTLDPCSSAKENDVNKVELAARHSKDIVKAVLVGHVGFAAKGSTPVMTKKKYHERVARIVASRDPVALKHVISVCGGCDMDMPNGRRAWVTDIDESGAVVEVVGLPVKVYNLLKILRLLR